MNKRTNPYAIFLDEVVERLKKEAAEQWEYVKVSMDANSLAAYRSLDSHLPKVQDRLQIIETLTNIADRIEQTPTEEGRQWVPARDAIDQMNANIKRLVRANIEPELIVNELRAVMILEDFFHQQSGPGI